MPSGRASSGTKASKVEARCWNRATSSRVIWNRRSPQTKRRSASAAPGWAPNQRSRRAAIGGGTQSEVKNFHQASNSRSTRGRQKARNRRRGQATAGFEIGRQEGRGAVAQGGGQRRERRRIGRDLVGLLLLADLEPVLDASQAPIRLLHPGGLRSVQEFVAGEELERLVGRRGLEERKPTRVQELERLRDELDLADPAGAALDVAVRAGAPTISASVRGFIAATSARRVGGGRRG